MWRVNTFVITPLSPAGLSLRAEQGAQTERCQYLSLLATNLDNTLQVLRRFLYLHQPGSANGLLRFRDMRERERESELL